MFLSGLNQVIMLRHIPTTKRAIPVHQGKGHTN